MAITLFDGLNLSGRSDALRSFAWADGPVHSRGVYLHPNPLANLSGLARCVGGEAYLHGLSSMISIDSPLAPLATLIKDLPSEQGLISLSGGQQVRLLIACALAQQPHRLAVDSLLEQLDPSARELILALLVQSELDCYISDNVSADIAMLARSIERRTPPPDVPQVNAALATVAERFGDVGVTAPVVTLHELGVAYPGKQVFRRCTFHFQPGRPYLLKAPNGAGKSSLARTLVGVVRPQAGSIRVDGELYAPWRSNRNLFAYAFQNPFDQMFGITVHAYLSAIAAAAAQRDGSVAMGDWNTVDSVLTAFALEAYAEREPFDLPPFIAKRVSIVAALVGRAPWLFFDEPSLWSDSQGRSALTKLLAALSRSGFGIIIVTHNDEFDSLDGAINITIAGGQLVVRERLCVDR